MERLLHDEAPSKSAKVACRGENTVVKRAKRVNEVMTNRKKARGNTISERRKVFEDIDNKSVVRSQIKAEELHAKSQATNRMDKLKEWKRQRQMKERKPHVKPPFVVKHVTHSPAKHCTEPNVSARKSFIPVFQKGVMTRNSIRQSSLGTRKSVQLFNIGMGNETQALVKGTSSNQKAVANKGVIKEEIMEDDPVVTDDVSFPSPPETEMVIETAATTMPEQCNQTAPPPVQPSGIAIENPNSAASTPMPSLVNRFLKRNQMNNLTPYKGQAIAHFSGLVKSTTQQLVELGSRWNATLGEEEKDMSEEVSGQIRTVIGQGQLLMDQRFKQFSDLIQLYKDKQAERPALSTDLEGFWEMINVQVKDVFTKYDGLQQLKDNAWEAAVVVAKPKTRKKKKADVIKKTTSEADKKRRQAMLAFKKAMLEKSRGDSEESYHGNTTGDEVESSTNEITGSNEVVSNDDACCMEDNVFEETDGKSTGTDDALRTMASPSCDIGGAADNVVTSSAYITVLTPMKVPTRQRDRKSLLSGDMEFMLTPVRRSTRKRPSLLPSVSSNIPVVDMSVYSPLALQPVTSVAETAPRIDNTPPVFKTPQPPCAALMDFTGQDLISCDLFGASAPSAVEHKTESMFEKYLQAVTTPISNANDNRSTTQSKKRKSVSFAMNLESRCLLDGSPLPTPEVTTVPRRLRSIRKSCELMTFTP